MSHSQCLPFFCNTIVSGIIDQVLGVIAHLPIAAVIQLIEQGHERRFKGPIAKINGMLCLVPVIPETLFTSFVPSLEILLDTRLSLGFSWGHPIPLDGIK
ncbi:hypothetical protein D3C85_1590450 [compost metagenome]